MRLRLLLPLAILLLLVGSADAQPGQTAPGQTAPYPQQYPQPQYQQYPGYVQQAQPLPTRTTSYGWHVFAADAATWAMLSLGDNGSSEGIATIGAMGLFFGGPMVHLAHGNTSGAGYSLLARAGLPLTGAFLGSATCDQSNDDWGCLGSVLLGTTLGYGAALAIDWFYLAKKTEVVGMPTGWASVRPSLNIAPDRAQAGVAFNF